MPVNGRNKRIFISDIHMGDDRSVKYGWLIKNVNTVADFLDEQLHSEAVNEVVILGDLFDQWVIPSDLDPLPTLEPIINANINRPIIDRLKELAENPQIKLSYVIGNHDMCYCQENINDWKNLLLETFPGITFICDPNLPIGIYNSGKLAAEHGNEYCLYCAPDTWTEPHSFIPLGYFMSRTAASFSLKTGKPVEYKDLIQKYHPDNSGAINEALFFNIAGDAGLDKFGLFNMKGIPGFPSGSISVLDVWRRYNHLMINWDKNHTTIKAGDAFYMDVHNDLSPAFEKVYLPNNNINIVIFGHTHVPAMIKVPGPESPCTKIYANSGTWIDGHTCTYVETEEDAANKRYYVRVKSYPGNQIVNNYEAYIDL